MLPTPAVSGRNLAGVARAAVAALRGETNGLSLAPVDTAVIVLVDGLGHAQLRQAAGHARTLARAAGAGEPIRTVYPSTTSAALTALATGRLPGEHGLVGYRILDPGRDALVTTLNDWESDRPAGRWMRSATIWETEAERGLRTAAIGPAKHASTGFTAAVLRGSDYVPTGDLDDRFAALQRVLAQGRHRVVYLYVSELDMAGHELGWESERWRELLEELDAQLAAAAVRLNRRTGLLVTADHGMLDVPAHRQLVVDEHAALTEGLRLVAGEPRFLHLYADGDAAADALAERWREGVGDRAWVRTREQAIAEGWFGPVDPEVLRRIGDVLVAARARIAFYTADAKPRSRAMVGQHGSLTDEETRVPLLRFGAFA